MKEVIPFNNKQIEFARQLARQVFNAQKESHENKFVNGHEYASDFEGFLAETVVADFFGLPRPAFLNGKNDVFDFKLAGLAFDLKCSSKRLVNCRQLERKVRQGVNAVMFCRLDFGDYEMNKHWLTFLGWIEVERIPFNSKKIYFANGSIAWQVTKGLHSVFALKKLKESDVNGIESKIKRKH